MNADIDMALLTENSHKTFDDVLSLLCFVTGLLFLWLAVTSLLTSHRSIDWIFGGVIVCLASGLLVASRRGPLWLRESLVGVLVVLYIGSAFFIRGIQ